MKSYIYTPWIVPCLFLIDVLFWFVLSYICHMHGLHTLAAFLLLVLLITAITGGIYLRYYFRQKVEIIISDDGFIFNIQKGNKFFSKRYIFDDLLGYKIRFAGKEANIPIIKLYEKSGVVKEYIFLLRKEECYLPNPQEIVTKMHLSIHRYNRNNGNDHQILFLLPFEATKYGLLVVIFFGFAYIVLIIIMLWFISKGYSMKHSAFVFIGGVVPFFSMLLARNKALNFYTEMIRLVDKELK